MPSEILSLCTRLFFTFLRDTSSGKGPGVLCRRNDRPRTPTTRLPRSIQRLERTTPHTTIMNHKTLVTRWMNRNVPAKGLKSGSLYCTPTTVFSYGPHFPLAEHITLDDGSSVIVKNPTRYSNSTSKHQSLVSGHLVTPDMWHTITDDASLRHAVEETQRIRERRAEADKAAKWAALKVKEDRMFKEACANLRGYTPEIPEHVFKKITASKGRAIQIASDLIFSSRLTYSGIGPVSYRQAVSLRRDRGIGMNDIINNLIMHSPEELSSVARFHRALKAHVDMLL